MSKRVLKCVATLSFAWALLFASSIAQAQVNVTTNRYDGFRTSSNLQETILNPSSVNASTFGKLWSYPVDGDVYAQPLYVQNVNVAGAGVHNVLYIATMHDVIYAFDADRPGAPLWTVDLRNASATPYLSANFLNPDWTSMIGDAFGILSTPVIDLSSNLMYVVAQTNEPAGLAYRLHAFDIRSGAEPIPNTLIAATSQGITFNAQYNNQRPGLALTGGQLYIGFGGRPDDDNPYHGWMMTYSAATLAQTSVYLVNGTSSGGAIWQGGGAPAIDEAGNVYAVSGNGFGTGDGVTNLSESLIKFSFAAGQLSVLDWFTASNSAYLDTNDFDLSTQGPLIVPGVGITAFGDKIADFYVANNANLGKVSTNNSALLQNSHIGTGTPAQFQQSNLTIGFALWPRPQGTTLLYAWPGQDKLFAFTLTGNQFQQTDSSTIVGNSMPGAAMVVSANGTQPGSGILWAYTSNGYRATNGMPANPGILRAFNAESLGTELWDSNMNAARDGINSNAKFAMPTVVNGRVYVPTFDGLVHVFGLLASSNFALAASPSAISVAPGATGSSTLTATANSGFTGTVTYTATGAPAGMTVSFNPSTTSLSTTTGSGQTVVTFAAASTTPAGSYPILITGTSGTLTQTATVTVTVSAAHTAPSVSLTAPSSNSTFPTGATITITAQASANGATVSQVAFFQGTTKLGTVTAAPYSFMWTNVPAGNYSLTAVVTDSLGSTTTSSAVAITVSAAETISVTPATTSLSPNQTQQFTANVGNVTNTSVTWSISPTVGAISASGLYTAPASIASQQTVTVTAISAANASKMATATITLNPPAAVTLSLTPSSANLFAGGKQQFTALSGGSATSSVTWSISPNTGSISASGLYTAPADVPAQTVVTITATSTINPAASASAKVTLGPLTMSISPSSATLRQGQRIQFTAQVNNNPNTAVKWSVSGGGSITSTGIYTAPYGFFFGNAKATVKATSVADPTKSVTSTVTIYGGFF